MAEDSKSQALPLQIDVPQHQVLEEDEPISSGQTLDNCITNCSTWVEEDDDLVNVDDDDVPYTFNIDPFSPFNSSFFVPSSSASFSHGHDGDRNHQVKLNSCSCCSSESESESDRPDSTVYPDCLYGQDEEYDQMDFITDLFDSRGETERDSGRFSSADVGVSVSEASAIDDQDDDFVSDNVEELGLGFDGGGLRVVGIESESDLEEIGVHSSDLHFESSWDCPSYDGDRREEIEEATARVDERDGLSSVIDRIEEISISSEISSEGDSVVGVLEWEILLAVNNLERDLEFESEGGEGFVYTAEFDTLIRQFVETVRALRGSPPAAKSFVDNLPLVALKKEDAKGGDHVVCAVCKDEILIEEKVTQLPCRHHYHGDCIVPWLSIRNTCPVCRYELPTDDVDYERSKNRADDDELRVGWLQTCTEPS